MFDENKRGFFELKNFAKVMKDNEFYFSKKENTKLFSVMDQNGNKQVTWVELENFIQEQKKISSVYNKEEPDPD